ncbi:FecR family protein [Gaoshiqia sp. Z1-71]|uniref:FecR family protein n=1 Tax=Gaoshiqia hydrogeniformans TaxID=3290090 RepID=UPI003BF85BA8
MKKELLIKYLKNNCTNDEFDEIVGWIETEALKKDAKSWSFDQWTKFKPDLKKKDECKFNALLYKIHYEINLKYRKDEETGVIRFSNVARWLSRAAAILFLPLLGVILYMLSDHNFQMNKYTDLAVDSLEIIAPVGSRTVVQLTDGTEINLNYGSKIKYPRNFRNTREVTLSGEGFFDVAHHPDKPFIVKTGKLNVKALGTKFNVSAYPDDDMIETTLVEGKVVIEKTIQEGTNQSIGTMLPGQHVVYHLNSGKVTTTKGSVDKYVAWKDGRLVFDNEPITGMTGKLGKMFNIDFEVADNAKDFSYTVTFFNDPLELILDLMTETTPITYNVLPRTRQSDGTLSKQKIRIEKR